MKNQWNLVTEDGEVVSAAATTDTGRVLTADPQHPNFKRIYSTLAEATYTGKHLSADTLTELFDLQQALTKHFEHLSERVAFNGGHITFDGDVLDNDITTRIVSFYTNGETRWEPFVLFLEKVMTNPSERARTHLFGWLERSGFKLAKDGDIIAYKGVTLDYRASNSGQAIINGELTSGQTVYQPGSVVEMPRSWVSDDPHTACHHGLHVANLRFAQGFSRKVIVVKVNPRDVVSVPDVTNEKLRVCRLYVVGDHASYIGNEEKFDATPTARVEAHTLPTDIEVASEYAAADLESYEAAEACVEKSKVAKSARRLLAATFAGTKLPGTYEEFSRRLWRALPTKELLKVAKMWDVDMGENPSREKLTTTLHKVAQERRASWGQEVEAS